MTEPMHVDDCVFCQRIVKGDYDEMSGDFTSVTFEPLHPVTEGHRLVVPVVHATDAGHWPGITADAFKYASRLARACGSDYNLITSSGPLATQSIYHLHIHIVPRREGDGLHLPWTDQTHD